MITGALVIVGCSDDENSRADTAHELEQACALGPGDSSVMADSYNEKNKNIVIRLHFSIDDPRVTCIKKFKPKNGYRFSPVVFGSLGGGVE